MRGLIFSLVQWGALRKCFKVTFWTCVLAMHYQTAKSACPENNCNKTPVVLLILLYDLQAPKLNNDGMRVAMRTIICAKHATMTM
jgi:hypothetical protein